MNMEVVEFCVRMVFILVVSYLLGSVNTSIIVGKLYGVDIRKEGSGNAGLTNTLRTLGKRAALVVLAGDILKGVISILLSRILAPVLTTKFVLGENIIDVPVVYTELAMQIAGIAVVLGHIFPVFYGFKGGKGVLTSIVVILMTQWQVGLACMVVFLITVLLTRYVSLGSILAAFSCPFFLIVFEKYIPQEVMTNTLSWLIFDVVLAVIVIWGHRGNFVRLVKNTERKLGEKKEAYEERIAKLSKLQIDGIQVTSITTWHEAFGFVVIVILFRVLSIFSSFDFGIIPLLGGIVGIVLGEKYVIHNINNIEKLKKSYIWVKRFTIILLICAIVISIGRSIYLFKVNA